jgi:ABC-type nickel/cobalt efflux system permease component RcnA
MRSHRLYPSIRRAVLALGLLAASSAAAAASSPFGVATPDSSGNYFSGPLGGLFAWIAVRQSEFYHVLTGALTDFKSNGYAAWVLLGVSFAYGVFHAAGPGHGKAVITSYLLASGESARRGIAISFAAALVQALSAILIVVVASVIFRVTAMTMTKATDWMEVGSYGLVALVGAGLVWSKALGGHHHHHHHFGGNHGHDHPHDDDHDHGHDHDHDHGHGAHHDGHEHDHGGHDHVGHDHDHGHGPAPAASRAAGLADRRGAATVTGALAKAWSAILAVGVRPCSGALIILVFALSQGLFAAGIAATLVMAVGTGLTVATLATLAVSAKGVALRLVGAESGAAYTVVRVAEIGGAAVVLLFGLLMLGGALAAR